MKRYVIFGCGRVGPNMAAYLEYLGHKVRLVSRIEAETERAACAAIIKDADIVAAAIPDDQLSPWRDAWLDEIGEEKIAVHFSGAASIKGVYGFHPLYSFPKSVLSSGRMKEIAFACEPSAPPLSEIFPGAPNPHFTVKEEEKARYHALAVLSGNMAAFLWDETAKDLSTISGMPAEKILGSYLNSIIDRFIESPGASMTGPMARRDRTTVSKNLSALENSPKLKGLYKAFLNEAWPDFDAPQSRL